jgi:hypothetical protein
MRSESISRRERRASSRLARVAAWLAAGTIVLATVAGCAEGTASDAERGKARDAQRTSVVSDLQATQAASVLQPGTPPPSTPTSTD